MAVVGGMENNGLKESSENSPGKALSSLTEMCRRNGINHTCQCSEKSCKSLETKRSKTAKPARVNGVSIKPSIPTLRSRGSRCSYPPESVKKKRRSSRLDKQETSKSSPPLYTKSDSCELVTRITDSNSNDCSALSLCMPDMTRSCTPQSGSTTPIFPPNSTSSSLLLLPTTTKVLSTATSTCTALQRTSCSVGGGTTQQQTQKDHVTCCWKNCKQEVDACGIIDHITQCHVDTQRDSEVFVCLWEGCKVYNKSSCSKTWLERHVLCHGGDKPFRCIVDGCSVRFTSQSGLERHVNSHFNTYQPLSSRGAKSKEDTPTKLLKKRKLKRGRVCTVKTDDFFDSRVMESIRHQLILFGERTEMDISGSGSSVTFHSSVIAKRTEESGKVKVLLHWQPEHILPDEWVPESQATEQSTRVVPLSCLPRDTVTNLDSSLYNTFRYRKHRRK